MRNNVVLQLLQRGVEEGRKREHEAFATMLLRKVKAKLAGLGRTVTIE